jgi:ribonuclease HIII
MTRKKNGSDKGTEEKKFEKFDVLDDKNPENQEKDDEFIVKMILKPLSSNDGTNLNDKPSKFNKILKKSKNRRNEETVTLTQMVKKASKPNEASNENVVIDDESSSSDSSESTSDEVEAVKKALKNTNLFLSAYGGGPRQKTSLIKLLYDVKPKYVILYDSELW